MPFAAADGVMIIMDHDLLYLQPEQSQLAAINYEDGMENLLISVSPGGNFTGDRAVWIFPVPARPENVKIDVLKGYPRFIYGQDFEYTLSGIVRISTAAQILYATFPVSILCGGGAIAYPFFTSLTMAANIQSTDVQVYDRVERMGVTTEIITARDSDALQKYLVSLGMDGKNDNREFLQSYIGKDYSFVVSYISDVKTFREATDGTATDSHSSRSGQNTIGVFARFPTDRIYFPLRPTAAYGERRVPVLLVVTGFVNPDLPASIRDDTQVAYLTQEQYTPESDLLPFFNGKTTISPVKYTKIKISTPSSRFTDDLWISPSPPVSMALKEAYVQYTVIISAIAYVIFSMVASLVAGMLVFRKKKAGCRTLLLHGLWNCTTFIGMALATRKKFPQDEYGKRGRFILAFYGIFAALLSICAIALSPAVAGSVLFGWALGLISPILSVFLLFIPSIFRAQIEYTLNPFTIFYYILGSCILVILAVTPIPVLLWLKNWIDPDTPVAPVPEKTGKIPRSLMPVLIILGLVIFSFIATEVILIEKSGFTAYRVSVDITRGTQPDNETVIVTYAGGPDAEELIALDISVSNPQGQAVGKFLGRVGGKTPVVVGDTISINEIAGANHVVVTGRFRNGNRQIVTDKDI
jgi:hypothetical protein